MVFWYIIHSASLIHVRLYNIIYLYVCFKLDSISSLVFGWKKRSNKENIYISETLKKKNWFFFLVYNVFLKIKYWSRAVQLFSESYCMYIYIYIRFILTDGGHILSATRLCVRLKTGIIFLFRSPSRTFGYDYNKTVKKYLPRNNVAFERKKNK